MNIAARIIGRFGGVRKLAALGGWPPSTVQSWKAQGLIPAQHQAKVLDLGKTLSEPLAPADFFDSPNASSEAA